MEKERSAEFYNPLSFAFLHSPPLPLPSPLEVGPLKPARGLVGLERCKLSQRGLGRPKTNLVHSKAVRKPLVAIILNILKSTQCHVSYLLIIMAMASP